MTSVKTSTGQIWKFAGYAKLEWGTRALWRSTCRSCGTPIETNAPRHDRPTNRVNVQMAVDSGAWRKYFGLVRCEACRKSRRT